MESQNFCYGGNSNSLRSTIGVANDRLHRARFAYFTIYICISKSLHEQLIKAIPRKCWQILVKAQLQGMTCFELL